MMYTIPKSYFFRLHHIRPRFKNDVENVLLFIANEISKIPRLQKSVFKQRLNNAIRLFPGNAISQQKTINNWRTEISSLFGFIQEDNAEGVSWPSKIAIKLSQEQDLVQFFKYFLYYFQYPGGHLKSHKIKELVRAGVKFKPAQYILKILAEGELTTGKRFCLNKAEVTHCVFNDLRVTRDSRDPKEVVHLILQNRTNNLIYDWTGDIIRYAGDILDYMVIADLLIQHGSDFYANWNERESITAFIQSNNWFNDYDGCINIKEKETFKLIENNWFNYVNTDLGESLFRTDVIRYLGIEKDQYHSIINNAIYEIEKEFKVDEFDNTKEIGDLGEHLILGHECMRIKIGNREDLIHLIKKIPTAFSIGYDIISVELDATKRLIEVKTTISNKSLSFYNFHLTTNEWKAAESYGDIYYVYRLMISKNNNKLFIIRDPVEKYKQNKLKMTPREGVDIIFNENTGEWTDLLIWKN